MGQSDANHEDPLPSAAYVRRLEAERDELRRRLGASERREATSEVTIDRQAASMAGQRVSIERIEDERETSRRRADRLQTELDARDLDQREKEMLLAWVLESSVDGVLVYRSIPGPDGEVADFECVLNNPAAERLYGLGGLAGQRLRTLHPDVHEGALWAHGLHVISTGEPFEGEYRYDIAGTPRWFRVLIIKVAGNLAVIFSDISPRKRMEADLLGRMEELKQADRMKTDFLAVISHELRTPINGIMGYLSILSDGLVGPLTDEQLEQVGNAEACAARLLALISNLLDMSRVQAGKFTVDLQPIELAPVVLDLLASLEGTTAGHVVLNQVPADLPAVLADEARVAQVFQILVDNAVKFSPAGSTIEVRARVVGDLVRCEVMDAGIGVAAADLPKLFAAFSQVDMSTTRERGGAGLGLILAKSLVEAQGGTIGAESVEGRGSLFWFTLRMAGG